MNDTKQSLGDAYDFERPAPRKDENDPGVCVTRESLTQFLGDCRRRGISDITVSKYGKQLDALYSYLPEDKTVRCDTLRKWRETLIERGYGNATVNAYLSIANAYLDFIGRREYQLPDRLRPKNDERPQLSRAEYLRLLETARRLDKERVYLLIKLFGTVELSVQELPKLTVEAIKSGKMTIDANHSRRIARLPEILQRELLDFAKRKGLESGPVFVTRDGRAMNRAYVTRMIRAICPAANVAENKGSTRSLQKLYQSTRASLESNISVLVDQAHERLLEQEQLTIGWEEGHDAAR